MSIVTHTLAGHGVAGASDKLTKLVDLPGIPVATTLIARSVAPDRKPS